ncbi:hypothetical protein [Bradyrhizobium canariense]|uniref:Uncharacterized protein n=1 Tax=Bradyrhizobium canariense TaxID=255045 RepID=A0A1H1QT94_9BRAD|nr:hypothetical protein [Bradyrhizobium canariense]SDS26698.1 hypothetical protein SAMN05444158_1528 [Bradyrhizobium canariense]
MEVATEIAGDSGNASRLDNFDLNFLPQNLAGQCRSLIESYHEVHGYSCLPDVLWKSRLGPLIQAHPEFRQLLKKASTTRSAKKSNQGFVRIATTLLSLEILASSFAGWSAIYPEAAALAQAILKRNARSPHMPLMEFYLYPPKYISLAAIATLSPPPLRQSAETELYRASNPELSGEKLALNYANSIREALDGKMRHLVTSPSV